MYILTYSTTNMLPIDKYDLHNVSHENGNKITASIQFFNLFPFYTKIITSILLYLSLVR